MSRSRLLLVLFSSALALAAGCHPEPGTPPAGPECVAVCEKLGDQGMHCPAFGSTPGAVGSDGVAHPVACATWLCRSYGIKTDCLLRATTCEEADSFQKHGCPR